ncbi:MAG: hypothetical protein JWO89_1229, partial [Verrucomicrobiaceae bacterium]|nr:hypothetical protein [Verrucomicrobiaceae bacterium]
AKSESLTIAKAALTDAASYTITVTGNVGQPVTCTAAKLGVVTVQNLTQVVKAGGTASFPATVKLPTGAQVTYQWRKGAQPLSIGGRITDATAKLTFTGVVAGDTDTYVCDVTLGSGIGAPMMTATTVDYTVLGTVPVIAQPAPLQTRVAAAIDFTPVATGRPTSWTATPLPPGVVFNATTGRISGKFSKSGQYNVKFTGTNLVGPAAMTYAITVDALTPATVGTFIALMDRDMVVNTGLGGRLDVTTTATGSFSGKLKLPIADKPFTGVLSGVRGTNPTAVNVPVPTTGLLLTFTIDEATGVITASVNNGIKVIGGTGVERAVASPSARAGAYNFALTPDVGSPDGSPQGEGYGQFTLATTGVLRITGKLADGTTFATDTFTAANGQIPVYIPSATGKGSVMGMINLNEHSVSGFANNFITGGATWFKNEEPTSRIYASGIPLIILNADGGRYVAPPTTEIVMKLPAGTGNATLTFAGAHLDLASRNPTNAFTVVKPAKATLVGTNAATPTLLFTTTTGLFNGQFVLSDTDTRVASHPLLPRTVLYYGVLIRPSGSDVMVGKGFFTLPQMPVGLETLNTSPILSGDVSLTRTALAPP